MCDFLRAVEFAAKAIRSGFGCVGAVVDAVAPLKPVFGHQVDVTMVPKGWIAANFPESPAVSATDAVEDASPAGAPVPAGDVPHTINGAPTFAVLQALLTEYAVDHGELRFDGGADHWSCQCGQALPDGGDGAYAALRDHCISLQTSALSFAIAEARNTQK